MKLTKIKKILSINLPILCGLSIGLPLILSITSCSQQNEWTFTNAKEANEYLLKHKVSFSDKHAFVLERYKGDNKSDYLRDDYTFIVQHFDTQLVVNAFISNLIQDSQFDWNDSNINIKKIDKNVYILSAMILMERMQSTIKYENNILSWTSEDEAEPILFFDFNNPFSYDDSQKHDKTLNHYVVFSNSNEKRTIHFEDQQSPPKSSQIVPLNSSIDLSVFDWNGKNVSWFDED
jgi:hypothetical protein